MQLSGYEEPLLFGMLRSINGENHDNELRVHSRRYLDDVRLANLRQTDAGADGRHVYAWQEVACYCLLRQLETRF